ncbi:MAG: hypothetical protein K6E16_11900, partial [Lachnospiraceae bacterium]|nr:hypothetical protein [Lachnospiraceae bacterium]
MKKRIRSFFKTLAEGKRGAEITLLLLAFLLSLGALKSMYAFLPAYISYPLSILAAFLVPLVLFAVLWLVFGTQKIVRALFITDLIFIIFF